MGEPSARLLMLRCAVGRPPSRLCRHRADPLVLTGKIVLLLLKWGETGRRAGEVEVAAAIGARKGEDVETLARLWGAMGSHVSATCHLGSMQGKKKLYGGGGGGKEVGILPVGSASGRSRHRLY